jgi:uncharacterized protein YidB (DUF937 family)
VDGLSPIQFGVSQIATAGLSNPQPLHQRSHPAMDAAAKALGMSASDLRTAMQNGQSLADIAKSKGVSVDTVTKAMATAIQGANPNVSADQATEIATALVNRTRPAASSGSPDPTQAPAATGTEGTTATGGHHHHHHHAMSTAVNAASSLLGTSASDIVSAMQSGKSLSDIAKSKGVSPTDLVKAVSDALQQANSNLSASDASTLATDLISRTPSSESQPWAAGTSAGGGNTFSIPA